MRVLQNIDGQAIYIFRLKTAAKSMQVKFVEAVVLGDSLGQWGPSNSIEADLLKSEPPIELAARSGGVKAEWQTFEGSHQHLEASAKSSALE